MAEGKAIHIEFAPKYDGKDYPVTGLPYGDAVSLKWIDSSTIEAVAKKDGKTRTTRQTGKNAMGQDVKNTIVYERQ